MIPEREISEDAAQVIVGHLDEIERVMSSEHDRLQIECGDNLLGFVALPPELRWRVMVLGSSITDLNFWIRRQDEDGGQWYVLTEIETGFEVGAVEPREACERYFSNDVLDYVRVSDG